MFFEILPILVLNYFSVNWGKDLVIINNVGRLHHRHHHHNGCSVDLPGGFAVGSGRVWGAKRWLPPNIGKVRIHPSNRPEPNIEQAQILKLPGSYIFRGSGGRNPRRKTIENFVDYGRLNPYITIMKSNNRRGSSHLGVLLLNPRGYVPYPIYM